MDQPICYSRFDLCLNECAGLQHNALLTYIQIITWYVAFNHVTRVM